MLNRFYADCQICRSCMDCIFQGFQDEILLGINEKKSCGIVAKGEPLFRENEFPKGLYLIHSGSVKISKSDEEGRELIVRLAKRGDFVGYRALLCNDRYQASAFALEDTYYCFLEKDYYLSILYSNPHVISHIITRLSADLLSAENKLMKIVNLNATGRIAEILLLLEEFYGTNGHSDTIKTTLKKEDIGHLAGTTTETSIRVMSEFKKMGIIDTIGKKIRIMDRKRLLSLSNRESA